MEEFFVISKRRIDNEWNFIDLQDEYYALEYCEQVLDIPEEYISNVKLRSIGLEIQLEAMNHTEEDEDWYVQLRHIARSA